MMAHPHRREHVAGRVLALLSALGLAYFAVRALLAGLERPDYVLVLLAVTLAVICAGFLCVATGNDE